ncbi:MAG: methylated-DNA--[protein]-cysteine S-methyltransferase [Pirellulales bacterium]
MTRKGPLEIASFSTELGWMAMVASESTIVQIVYGYASAAAALAALDAALARAAIAGDDWLGLVERLQDFAAGKNVDFRDVPIELSHLTAFQRRVVKHCRAIPYGQTRSYGELAALAGSPRAARAVGNTMAANRFAIVVPCHRVVNADGSAGHYGAPGGSRFKRRVLEMERPRAAACGTVRQTAGKWRGALERV